MNKLTRDSLNMFVNIIALCVVVSIYSTYRIKKNIYILGSNKTTAGQVLLVC